MQRAKEVGVRKSIGAARQQIVLQFIGETVLLSYISIVFSAMLVKMLLPWLNQFTGKHISINLMTDPGILALLLLLGLVTGVFAGFYPALVLSAFKPVKVLKGSICSDVPGRAGRLRNTLVITQFTLSILLMISAIVVFKQVSYLHHKDLGFNKDEIMFFPMRGDNMSKNQETFKNSLLHVPGVSSVSIGYGFPGDAVAGKMVNGRSSRPRN
jgi:putative ABC transport system permease protein